MFNDQFCLCHGYIIALPARRVRDWVKEMEKSRDHFENLGDVDPYTGTGGGAHTGAGGGAHTGTGGGAQTLPPKLKRKMGEYTMTIFNDRLCLSHGYIIALPARAKKI